MPSEPRFIWEFESLRNLMTVGFDATEGFKGAAVPNGTPRVIDLDGKCVERADLLNRYGSYACWTLIENLCVVPASL